MYSQTNTLDNVFPGYSVKINIKTEQCDKLILDKDNMNLLKNSIYTGFSMHEHSPHIFNVGMCDLLKDWVRLQIHSMGVVHKPFFISVAIQRFYGPYLLEEISVEEMTCTR
jgi:hypothetical protein